MAVTMEQLKQLRDATGVSIMACKKALEESGGDFDKAVDILRKKGEAKAGERAARSTAEGAIAIKAEGNKGAIVKLECETDFVARGDDFLQLLDTIVDKVYSGEISASDTEVQDAKDAGYRMGENIQVGAMGVVNGDHVGGYVHSNKKIGVLVALNGGSEDLAKDIAMHAAATNPQVVSPEEVSQDLIEREKAIWSEQLANEGKPAEIVEKIMMGKEKKFREENALLKQAFVKNPEKTIEQLLSEAGATISGYVRYAI